MATGSEIPPGPTMGPVAVAAAEIDYPASDGEPMGETGWHVRAIFTLYEGLRDRFADRDDVYVASNMFLYYKEGQPGQNKCPDCMVIFGVGKDERRVFKTWEEGAAPSVIFEVSSPETFRKDIGEKLTTYATLGVPEYYLFDPTGDCLDHPLVGYRFIDGDYEVVRPDDDGALLSPILGLRLLPIGKRLRLVDPDTSQLLLTGLEKTRAMDAAIERAKRAALETEEAKLQTEQAKLQTEKERVQTEKERLRADHERVRTEKERARADGLALELERIKAENARIRGDRGD